MSNRNYSEYRNFFETLIEDYNALDPLPIRIGGYNITESELPGEVIRSSIEYLTEKNCPKVLMPPIIHKVLENIRNDEVTQNSTKSKEDHVYSPLKLMQMVVTNIFSICQNAVKNELLEKTLPLSTWPKNDPPICAISSIKNSRRVMEDRHILIEDFDGIHNTGVDEKTSFYGIYDGHAGTTASAYTASQLHSYLARSPNYATNPLEALKDAFRTTDLNFIDKCNKEKLSSGTTALCVLYRPTIPCLFVGWVGDSQALLARKGKVFQIVRPHKPNHEAERKRIQDQGGWVIKWNGSYRVNGSLAVARAIGDAEYKPYVTGEPDVRQILLTGEEDFLVLASDGLWDFATENDIAINVYLQVRQDPANLDLVTKRLVELSKTQGSTDNITIIVVFLKDPNIIATSTWPSENIPCLTENMDTAYDTNQESQKNLFDMDYEIKTTTGEFAGKLLPSDIDNENYNIEIESGNVLDYSDIIDNSNQLITTATTTTTTTEALTTNGKRSADNLIDEEYDEDLGPETDVDTLDEIMMSPKEVKEEKQVESKDIDETTKHINTDNLEEAASLLIDEAAKKFELNSDLIDNIISVDGTNPFEDNKIKDLLDDDEVDEMKITSELVDRVTNELLMTRDISIEKQDQSFEKDDLDDVVAAKDDITQETVISQVLETSATAEHHAVAESGGEDSEDEWNYIKGDKKLVPAATETIEEDEQKELLEQIEESHALSQAIAESQEACADLISSEQDDDGLDQELIDIEKNSAKEFDKFVQQSPPQHELTSLKEEQNEDINTDDDEMSSQLNPDAKEFVPTSPVRSTNQSPFNLLNQNGATLNPHQSAYLFEEDNIIAQSPRKGTPMDDITLPAETDFDNEISRRPAELEAQNGETTSVERPGSSSSQASYQEMNLKEAMHGDEKLEYAPEVDDLLEQTKENVDAVLGQLSAKVLSETDPMNMSFYQDNDNDIVNPFDLNSVQQLPLDDEFESGVGKTETTQKITFEGEQGQRFVIEDNDFGMQENLVWQDEISKPEDDMYSPVSDNKILDDNSVVSHLESDKPESELLLQDKPNDTLEQLTEEVSKLVVIGTENSVNTVTTDNAGLIVDQIELASEIIPLVAEEQPESESSFLQKSEELFNSIEPNFIPDFTSGFRNENLIADVSPVDVELALVDNEPAHSEAPPPTPAVLNIELNQRIITPEPQEIIEAVERLSFEPEEKSLSEILLSPVLNQDAFEPSAMILNQTDDKSEVESTSPSENEPIIAEQNNIEVAAVTAIAATTLAATAAVVAASNVAEKESVKTSEPAKQIKSSTKTATPLKAKTPIAAAKKSSTPTSKPSSASKSATTASRPSSKPLSSPAPTKTVPAVAAKTATKTTVTLTKKPLTNGEAKTSSLVKKSTATSTTKTGENVTRSSAGSVRSTTTTTTTRTLSTAPRTTTSTLAKTSATKTATSPRTATAPKATPATTKPLTTTSSKPTRPVVSTTSAPSTAKTTTARSVLSPTKVKPTPPTSTVTDKQSKDTTNKLRTAPSTLKSTTKPTTATSRTGTTAPAKKVTDVKSPTAKPRTATGGGTSSSSTTTTTTTTKSSAIGGTRKPTTTTRTGITKKTTTTSTISKSGTNDNKATKLTTVKLEKQLLNGDVISEKSLINTTILDGNGDIILNEDNENIIRKNESVIDDHHNQMSSPPLFDNSQMIVIDSATD